MIAFLAARLRAVRSTVDGGVSLIEVSVAMVIMGIFMGMFFGGIMQVFQSSYHAESAGTAQTQINIMIQRLDKEIRYAAGISTQGQQGGNWYVEYLTTSGGSAVCTELRVNVAAAQLQTRTWAQGASPLVPTAWIPLASQLYVAAGAPQPFTFKDADATYNFQRLYLQLRSDNGTGPGRATRETKLTFSALNTSLGTTSSTVCTEGRAVP